MKMVLQKFMVEAGYCSRRQATELIKNGRVKVNGRIAELGARVDAGDKVDIEGECLHLAEKKIYIKLNKPVGYTCTNRKFKGEKNVFDLVKTDERLFVVGRLDKNSRGLVLLTNDGDLTKKLTHPRYGHEKSYELRIRNYELGDENEILNRLKSGMDIGEGDGVVKVKDARYLGSNKFKIVLTEGKKRQIRRMFKVLGLEVVDLARVKIGNLEIGDLKEGKWKYLKNEEIVKLKQERC